MIKLNKTERDKIKELDEQIDDLKQSINSNVSTGGSVRKCSSLIDKCGVLEIRRMKYKHLLKDNPRVPPLKQYTATFKRVSYCDWNIEAHSLEEAREMALNNNVGDEGDLIEEWDDTYKLIDIESEEGE